MTNFLMDYIYTTSLILSNSLFFSRILLVFSQRRFYQERAIKYTYPFSNHKLGAKKTYINVVFRSGCLRCFRGGALRWIMGCSVDFFPDAIIFCILLATIVNCNPSIESEINNTEGLMADRESL